MDGLAKAFVKDWGGEGGGVCEAILGALERCVGAFWEDLEQQDGGYGNSFSIGFGSTRKL